MDPKNHVKLICPTDKVGCIRFFQRWQALWTTDGAISVPEAGWDQYCFTSTISSLLWTVLFLPPFLFPLNRRGCIFFFFSIHLVKCSLCPEALDMDRTWPRKNYWNLILPPTFSLFFLNLKMHLLPKALFWRGRYSREPLNKIYSLLRRQINGNCKRTGKLSQGLICVFILAVTIVSITALGK